MHIRPIRLLDDETPVALIFGTGDIASAIARELFLSQWGAIVLRDEAVPVMRRGMSFDDALEDGVAQLEGVRGARATAADMLPTLARERESVVVARLDPAVVSNACRGIVSVLIDARMRKYAAPADLRPLAASAIGVGPGFVAGENVDIAIETLPGQEGDILTHGATATPTGRSVPLGGAREERFACAIVAGAWDPFVALGAFVRAGTPLGFLGESEVRAPIDGCVRGVVRAMPNGVARGAKLVELDPRPGAPWTGVPPRAHRIAAGVQRAVGALLPVRPLLAVG
jgi:hypothetical protein